jgi:hypothetical protein
MWRAPSNVCLHVPHNDDLRLCLARASSPSLDLPSASWLAMCRASLTTFFRASQSSTSRTDPLRCCSASVLAVRFVRFVSLRLAQARATNALPGASRRPLLHALLRQRTSSLTSFSFHSRGFARAWRRQVLCRRSDGGHDHGTKPVPQGREGGARADLLYLCRREPRSDLAHRPLAQRRNHRPQSPLFGCVRAARSLRVCMFVCVSG